LLDSILLNLVVVYLRDDRQEGDPPSSETNHTFQLNITGESCSLGEPLDTPTLTGYGPEGDAIELLGDNYLRANAPVIPQTGSYTFSVWAKQTVDQTGFVNIYWSYKVNRSSSI